jgi:hypothetical protein
LIGFNKGSSTQRKAPTHKKLTPSAAKIPWLALAPDKSAPSGWRLKRIVKKPRKL